MGVSQETSQQNDSGRTDGPARDEPIRLLGRDDILHVSDMKYEIVDVPEWGGKVRVRSLTGAEVDAYNGTMIKQRGANIDLAIVNIRAGLCARAICDHLGNRVFSDADIVLLGQKSAAALERVYEVAARLSTISEAAVEKMVGNSESNRSGEPSSA